VGQQRLTGTEARSTTTAGIRVARRKGRFPSEDLSAPEPWSESPGLSVRAVAAHPRVGLLDRPKGHGGPGLRPARVVERDRDVGGARIREFTATLDLRALLNRPDSSGRAPMRESAAAAASATRYTR